MTNLWQQRTGDQPEPHTTLSLVRFWYICILPQIMNGCTGGRIEFARSIVHGGKNASKMNKCTAIQVGGWKFRQNQFWWCSPIRHPISTVNSKRNCLFEADNCPILISCKWDLMIHCLYVLWACFTELLAADLETHDNLYRVISVQLCSLLNVVCGASSYNTMGIHVNLSEVFAAPHYIQSFHSAVHTND